MGFAGSGRRLKCSSDRCCSRISLVGLDSEVVEIRSQRRTSGPDPACIYVQKCERIPAGDSVSKHAVTLKAPLLLLRLAPKVSASRRDNASRHEVPPKAPRKLSRFAPKVSASPKGTTTVTHGAAPCPPQSQSPPRRSTAVERARRATSGSLHICRPGAPTAAVLSSTVFQVTRERPK